jgi:phage terminase small subunit
MSEKKLSAQQIKFAKVYAETHNAIEAYKAAYGEERASKVKYLQSTAYHKLDDPGVRALIEHIQQGLRAQYIMAAPDAFENLCQLADHAESEKVRLEANKEILYGAGLKPPDEVTLRHTGIFGGVPISEIRNMIKNHVEDKAEPEVPTA